MSARIGRRLGVLGLASALMLALAPAAHALEFRGGDEIVIAQSEVIADDAFLSGTTITVNGTVKGDLIVVGREVRINGIVEGDLMGAAQSVIVNGEVRDDVRVAGAVVTVGSNARVTDDLLTAGGSVETQVGSAIGGDAYIGASRALLAGAVSRDLFIGGERASLQGPIGGNVYVDVDSAAETDGIQPWMFQSSMPTMPPWVNVPAGLTVGTTAKIGGKLEYTSPKPGSIAAGVARDVTHTPKVVAVESAQETTVAPAGPGNWLLAQARSYVSLTLVGLLLLWLLPNLLPRTADALSAKPWPSLGWGFISVVLIPAGAIMVLIVAIMLAVLFGTLTLSDLSGSVVVTTLAVIFAVLVAFGLVIGYASKLIAAYWLARAVFARIWPERTLPAVSLLILGLIPVVLLTAAPYVGGLLTLAIVFFTLGALWLAWRDRNARPAPVTPAAPTQAPFVPRAA